MYPAFGFLISMPVRGIAWVAEKIGEALLYLPTELAGALVMRGLRKWAKGYRVEAPAEVIQR